MNDSDSDARRLNAARVVMAFTIFRRNFPKATKSPRGNVRAVYRSDDGWIATRRNAREGVTESKGGEELKMNKFEEVEKLAEELECDYETAFDIVYDIPQESEDTDDAL